MDTQSPLKKITTKIRLYWVLMKSLQTGLLLSTGLAGYISARCPVFHLETLIGLTVSLLLSISGSTILNMWWDRDIDAKMRRTQMRPISSGAIAPTEALWVGLLFSAAGVGLAVMMDPLYGLIIFAGLFFDVVVYTIWLKRRTCWSIVWGGISGGMPILAGRALGVGSVDGIGVLLCLGILFWIPTHILTYSMKYAEDYQAASIPTFASTYGFSTTRLTIAVSSVFAIFAMGFSVWQIGVSYLHFGGLVVISIILVVLATASVLRPTGRLNFSLFKFASVYMLMAMVLMVC